jgi:hypothetical protein
MWLLKLALDNVYGVVVLALLNLLLGAVCPPPLETLPASSPTARSSGSIARWQRWH